MSVATTFPCCARSTEHIRMAATRFLRQIAPNQASLGLPRAERPLVAIGDIQGCNVLLDRMLAHLAAQPDAAQVHLICLGDMIGKGQDSAAVLRRLRALCHNSIPFANCLRLMGDHERLMLTFWQTLCVMGPHDCASAGKKRRPPLAFAPLRPNGSAKIPRL